MEATQHKVIDGDFFFFFYAGLKNETEYKV